MKKIIGPFILAMAAIANAQVSPPAVAAFTYSAGSWVAAASSATGAAISYVPQSVALYCYNATISQWVPADSSCFGGGGILGIQANGATVTPSSGIINFAAGTNVTLGVSGNTITITASSTAATAFSAITSATNTTAAMLVGTGASLAPSGAGTIGASTLEGGALGSLPYQSAANTTAFVSPNTTTAKEFYSQTGTGTAGAAPALAVLASTDIPAVNLAGTGNGGVTGTLPYTSLGALSANQVLGALTATTPSGLSLPSCSGASNALIWTSGTGFGCNTISASGLTFPVTVGGTVNSGGIPYFSAATTMSSSATLTQYGVMYGGGAGAAPTVVTPPVADGLYSVAYNVTGGVATAPTAVLAGFTPRAVSGTAATDTVAYSDNGQAVDYTGTVAVAVTLPTPTTLGNANFYTILENFQTNAVTVTPTTYTISWAGGSTGASIVISPGQSVRIGVDPANPTTNWVARPNIESFVAPAHNWISAINALTGVPTATQPAFTDISGTLASSQIPAQYKVWSCETGLGDGLNAVPAGTYLQTFCKNTTGVTVTLTGLQCYTDNAGTSTMNAAGNTLGALLTGAVTCSTSFASGTQSSNVALTNGDYINFTFVADGTSKQTTFVVTGTY